ncbi:MAG: AarF/UbiB family protein [Polyangiaceae bacterium]
MPEVPFEAIRDQVERSLGAELAEMFESFDEKPLAAWQAHRFRSTARRCAQGQAKEAWS